MATATQAERRQSAPATDTTPPRLLVSISEAARMLCIGKSFAYQLANAGELQTVRVGRSLRRVPISAVEAFIARRLAESQESGGAA